METEELTEQSYATDRETLGPRRQGRVDYNLMHRRIPSEFQLQDTCEQGENETDEGHRRKKASIRVVVCKPENYYE